MKLIKNILKSPREKLEDKIEKFVKKQKKTKMEVFIKRKLEDQYWWYQAFHEEKIREN